MQTRNKLFIKALKALAAKNGLNCKLQWLADSHYYLDLWNKRRNYNSFKYYICYNTNRYYLEKRMHTSYPKIFKKSSKENEMLRFLEIFIKRNYRKF